MRNYENVGIENAAQVISEEVKSMGKSVGWMGNIDAFIQVQEELSKQNINYSFLGQWH